MAIPGHITAIPVHIAVMEWVQISVAGTLAGTVTGFIRRLKRDLVIKDRYMNGIAIEGPWPYRKDLATGGRFRKDSVTEVPTSTNILRKVLTLIEAQNGIGCQTGFRNETECPIESAATSLHVKRIATVNDRTIDTPYPEIVIR